MKGFGTFLIILSIFAFIACGLFAYQSYDKYTNYRNSDSFYSRNVNAYVGGDAYNYIINGTYFTGFAVCSIGCAVIGSIFLSIGGFLISLVSHNTLVEALLFGIKKQNKSMHALLKSVYENEDEDESEEENEDESEE